MVNYLKEIQSTNEELCALNEKIRSGQLECRNIIDVNGDIRFWDVGPENSPILRKFIDSVEKQNIKTFGKNFKNIIVMVNYINPQKSPEGSGGGWHVDSVRDQFKVFMYLTECLSVDNGPLTLLSSDNFIYNKFHVLKNYFSGNKFRFSDNNINKLQSKGFKKHPVLEPPLIPFMVNTSTIHRGEKISYGERIMVTAYMYDKVPESIAKNIKH